MTTPSTDVRAGFIPLIDCAPLVVASELGFAEEEGLNLKLVRETSWATIRDRLAVSHLDVAHILAPMPVAANLGLGPLPTEMVVPMALGSGANSITIARKHWTDLAQHMGAADFAAQTAVRALAQVVAQRKKAGLPRLTLGVVHPFSAHHYQLTYWLAAAGLKAGDNVDLVVVPPSLMPAALASGRIDGFCAGEPWGTAAVLEGSGVILTTNAHIWQNSPEKVLGARSAWAEGNPGAVSSLVRAVYKAAVWCDGPDHQDELARLLARNEYVGLPVQQLRPCLSRRLRASDGQHVHVEGFLNFASKAATFPWTSHALWFLSQMVRWDQVELTPAAILAARSTYRPDLYRTALAPLGIELPSANSKLEGALATATLTGSTLGQLNLGPDKFFDGLVFDPERIEEYLALFDSNAA